MRNRVTMAVLAVLVLVGLAATLSLAAGPKQYQWTGTVTDVDAKAKTMSVDKGGDIWEFSTEGVKDLKVKKGDKVTVTYVAIAKKIDMKSGPAPVWREGAAVPPLGPDGSHPAPACPLDPRRVLPSGLPPETRRRRRPAARR